MADCGLLATRIETLADGRSVRCARLGLPGPTAPVILLHGYPDNLQIWSRVAPLLARHGAVIAVDWPGLGDSPAWPGGTTPGHLAERLLALLDHWGIGRASLVGMDMGGQPALVFAARHPGRVHALAVMNTLAFGDEATSWDIALLRRHGWNRWLLRHWPRLVFARAVHTALPWGGALPPEVRADFWRCFAHARVRDVLVRLCAGYQGSLPALPETYRCITVPTLLLWGGRDHHFPLRQGERLQALIPGSRLHLVREGRHWMVMTHAEEIAAQIQAFCAEPGTAAAPSQDIRRG